MPPDPNRKLTQEAKDAFRQGAELIKSKDLNFDSVKVIDEQIDGDTATVKLQAVGPNGVEVHLESQTLRIDGVWYVDTEPPTSP